MRRRKLIWLIPVVISVLAWAIFAIPQYLVGIHQQSVTRELAAWEEDYRGIESHQDAVRTAEMIEYVQQYYVPKDGYRSTPRIEAALERQRQETVAAFIGSLRQHTGQNFGDDAAKWRAFLHASATERAAEKGEIVTTAQPAP